MDIGNAISRRIALQNYKIMMGQRFPQKYPKWANLKRLTVESATRRSLSGAKGMRP